MSKNLVPKGKKSADKQLTPQNDHIAQINNLFLVPLRSPNAPFKSPLVYVADILRARGFVGHNLRAALLTILILNSARLNRRIAQFLVCKDLSIISTMVAQCLEMIPLGFYREFNGQDQKFLFSHWTSMNGQALYSTNPEGFKKVISDIISIIDRGYATSQAEAKSKYGADLSEHKIDPMISLLGAATGHDEVPDHPGTLYVPLQQQLGTNRFLSMDEQESRDYDLLKVRIRNNFQRLKLAPLNISFKKELLHHIEKQSPEHADKKTKTIFDILSLCTIVNNPPSFTNIEFTASLLKISPEELVNMGPNAGATTQPSPLTASKVDYYTAWLLLSEIIPSASQFLTDRQLRIFNRLKSYNLDAIRTSTFATTSAMDQLATIRANENFLPDRYKLCELINQGSTERFSLETMYKELEVLQKKRLIDSVKDSKNKKLLYYVNILDSLNYVELPHPKDIQDPVYSGRKVSVINPLTNTEETI